MDKQTVLDMIHRANQMKSPIRRYPQKTIVHYGDITSNSLLSFKSASMKLGCSTLTANICSETLEEGIQMLQYYGDVLVVRHPSEDAISRATAISRVPILQGGIHENIAQALTDIYTLYKELHYRGIQLDSENRESIQVTFLGYSRTVQPFVKLLDLFPKIEYHYSQKDVPSETDVLYVSRIQESESYHIDRTFLKPMKHTMILMHPFPRTSELSTDVDRNPRSVYLNQLENGVWMRMAILDKLLSPTCNPTIWEWCCFLWIYILERIALCMITIQKFTLR